VLAARNEWRRVGAGNRMRFPSRPSMNRQCDRCRSKGRQCELFALSPRPSRSRGEALASAHACALAYAMEAGAPRAPARRRQPHEPPTSAETRRAHLLALYINRALNPVLHFTIKQLLVEDGVRGPFVPVAAHGTPQKTSARAPSYALKFPGR
jgi:hypothetical protein